MSKDITFNLLEPDVPLVFTDGTKVYKQFEDQCVVHKTGYFILAPSGTGKTHFIKNQKEQHWIDGDLLWMAANAHPNGPWWEADSDVIINTLDVKCDVITLEAKKRGLWIMGASNSWLKPDAIVIPNWEIHKQWIKHREENNYDGGATTERLDGVLAHRKWIEEWADKGVPKFETVQEAADFLAKQ